ncbi:MAG: hypothetical protein QXD03_02000 [Candidatus Anstonellales archaeon]
MVLIESSSYEPDYISSIEPTTKYDGLLWLNDNTKVLKIYSGGTWITVDNTICYNFTITVG